jgi:spoIIIJ-associated protein
MEYIEITGKTVDEAITNATIKLSVTSDKLEYEVVDKGSKGFLGINSRPAVIKVRIAQKEDEFEQAVKNVTEPKREDKPVAAKKPEPKKENYVPKHETKSAPENVKPVQDEKPVQVKSAPVEKTEATENGKPSKKPVAGADMEPAIKKFLGDVLNAMGMQAEVKVVIDENEGSVDIELVGENMGVLIGKRGQTLDSLQYLVSLVANKEADGYFRVKLDTENYRARRKETLESLAKNIAYKVKRTRKPVSLEPMNPYERRIIHSALQNDKYVATRSEGEEPFRHVVVYLRKNV